MRKFLCWLKMHRGTVLGIVNPDAQKFGPICRHCGVAK